MDTKIGNRNHFLTLLRSKISIDFVVAAGPIIEKIEIEIQVGDKAAERIIKLINLSEEEDVLEDKTVLMKLKKILIPGLKNSTSSSSSSSSRSLSSSSSSSSSRRKSKMADVVNPISKASKKVSSTSSSSSRSGSSRSSRRLRSSSSSPSSSSSSSLSKVRHQHVKKQSKKEKQRMNARINLLCI